MKICWNHPKCPKIWQILKCTIEMGKLAAALQRCGIRLGQVEKVVI